jgi:cysteine desulfuration protein SufE
MRRVAAIQHTRKNHPNLDGSGGRVHFAHMTMPTYDEIAENLSVLDDWEERYAYLIQIGKALPALPDTLRTETNRVQGCASQVWLATSTGQGDDPALVFQGDSDALIVRGLVALAIALNSGKKASEIVAMDTFAKFDELGLKAHLSSQRSNGLRSMVARIKRDAEAAGSG